ncbi:MAG TPA: hypothetical protein VF884_04685, partial [Nitrososphaeraceae archaeon]
MNTLDMIERVVLASRQRNRGLAAAAIVYPDEDTKNAAIINDVVKRSCSNNKGLAASATLGENKVKAIFDFINYR